MRQTRRQRAHATSLDDPAELIFNPIAGGHPACEATMPLNAVTDAVHGLEHRLRTELASGS